jgi:hypothetical protein
LLTAKPQRKLTAKQRRMRASIAALTRWSQEDPAANAARGQAGLRAKFTRQIAEEFPGLAPDELARRADCAYRAHMRRVRYAGMRRTPDEAA